MRCPVHLAFLILGLVILSPVADAASLDLLEREIGRAEAALAEGEMQLAQSHYRDALLEGWLITGALHVVSGDFEEAASAYERASTSAVARHRARLSLALVQLRSDRVDDGIGELRRLVTRNRLDVDTRRILARALIDAGRPEEAIPELEDARAAAPEDVELAFALATTFLRLDRLSNALELFEEVLESRPIPQTSVLVGRTLRDFAHYEEARTMLEDALQGDPEVRRAHYYLGTIDLLEDSQARFDSAARHFEAELAIAPEDALANLYLGMVRVEGRQFAEALSTLLMATKAEPPTVDAYHYLGRCYIGLERTAEAVETLQRALEISETLETDPRQLQSIHYQLGVALRAEGQDSAGHHFAVAQELASRLTDEDRASLARFLTDTQEAEPLATDYRVEGETELARLSEADRLALSIKVERFLARSYFNLGVLRLQKGEPRRAATLLEQAAALQREFPGLARTLGIAYFNAGRFAAAVSELERHYEQEPADPVVRHMLALAELELEDYGRTVALLEDDLERERDPSLQYAYGLALVRSDRSDQAQQIFGRLIEEQSDWPELHVVLGHTQAQEGDWPEAIASFEQALALRSDVRHAHSSLGLLYLQQGELAKAEDHLRSELELFPDDIKTAYHLATVLELNEKPDVAERMLRSLLARAPEHADGRYLLGKLLLERGAAQDAVSHLERAAALAPATPTIRYQLGLAYQRLGNRERAADEFQRFQDLKKDQDGGPE